MGREWSWGSKTSSSTSASAPSPTTTTTKKEDMSNNSRGTPGCMSGVLHLFDFHQFQFPITQPPCFKPNSILQEDPTSFTKGVEAPRNSLESDETSPMFSTQLKQEDDFPIPVEIRVQATSAKDQDSKVSFSDSSNSPGPKTPSLVARLMGLDLLPETLSPSPSLRKSHHSAPDYKQKKSRKNNFAENEMKYESTGSRSLPDTPRISSARRSDVEARFSLQLNKENMTNNEEFDYFNRFTRDHQKPRKSTSELRNEEESRSPGHYARQIVKQVKESVSRRVGLLDITNTSTSTSTTTNSHSRFISKEVDVVLLKSKKPKRLTKIGEESTSNSSKLTAKPPPSLPPPLMECNKVKAKFSAKVKSKPKPKPQALPQHQTMEKCKKASCERFTQRKETRSKPENKCKVTHASKQSAMEPSSSISTSTSTERPKPINSRLSSSSSRTWCVTPLLNDRDDNINNDHQTTKFADEIRYVSEILKCTGIHKNTLVSFTRWFSPSHPLDPSIFPYLEEENLYILQHRCNRRLLFELIDELLANFLKPYLNMKPWFKENRLLQREIKGEGLVQSLCEEMRRFPSLKCENLEDIDGLVERDLPDQRIRTIPLYEETESIVCEIEQDILDSLVHETAADVIIRQQKRRLCVSVTDTDNVTWGFT